MPYPKLMAAGLDMVLLSGLLISFCWLGILGIFASDVNKFTPTY